jgi:hypothetical protein
MVTEHRRRFVITFQDQHARDNVDGMLESNFIGLGETYRGKDSKVLYLHPFPHITDAVLKETLDELKAVGALTYTEELR